MAALGSHTILVAGIGNIFLGDDAFGVEVARHLMRRRLPADVRVRDFGIRGYDLACALMEHPATILVDATPRGGAPGTLYSLELDPARPGGSGETTLDGHSLDPVSVLLLVPALGGSAGRVFLVGCEPASTDTDPDGAAGLSAPVAAAIDGAAEMVLELVRRIRAETPVPAAVPAHA